MLTSKDQLQHGPGGVGGFLRDGTPVPLHMARMLSCDSARVDVVTGADGQLLDVGRSTRAIPSAISRALWLRDGGCRVPGCGRNRHLHGHHIQGWAEGGPTRLSNLVLVCPGHHRMIHEGGLSVEIRADKIMFIDQRGHAISAAPPRVDCGQDLESLERFLREADLLIDDSTAAPVLPKWDGRPMNLGEALDWMFIADRSRTSARQRQTSN
ncbi:HNH endonuclease domain protein [Enhygromyxa salina]|uniref:HNH endonuclease domain protein n=1 Tax=Enhygromyxa salina TaxID=215803 RepID=A0A0C2D247_9BACT|nr:HNH endonuclease signature motif containing protein [Enhygromyxa salina]KIG14202.1 HNH endonuclease domain protein [Enhygromyxa salina]